MVTGKALNPGCKGSKHLHKVLGSMIRPGASLGFRVQHVACRPSCGVWGVRFLICAKNRISSGILVSVRVVIGFTRRPLLRRPLRALSAFVGALGSIGAHRLL